MPIWKLTPVDLTDRNWEASKYKCEVIVRAATEERARYVVYYGAPLNFTKRISPAGDTLIAPWQNPDSVKCEQLNSSEYPEDGPEAILAPEYVEFEI